MILAAYTRDHLNRSTAKHVKQSKNTQWHKTQKPFGTSGKWTKVQCWLIRGMILVYKENNAKQTTTYNNK